MLSRGLMCTSHNCCNNYRPIQPNVQQSNANTIPTPLNNVKMKFDFISKLPKLMDIDWRCIYVWKNRKKSSSKINFDSEQGSSKNKQELSTPSKIRIRSDSIEEKKKSSSPINVKSINSCTFQKHIPNKKTPDTISIDPVNLKKKSETDGTTLPNEI